jgi:hypothetical protein
MTSDLQEEVKAAERELCRLFALQYPDTAKGDDGPFNQGLSDGFALSLRGLLDNAFPRRR